MSYVLFNPNPNRPKGLPVRWYVSRYYGRNDSPGYLGFTDRLSRAKVWKTLGGVQRFQELRPGLRDFEITEIDRDAH